MKLETLVVGVILLAAAVYFTFCPPHHPVNPDHKVHTQPYGRPKPIQEPKKDDNSALDDFTNPANPIGLFSSNWMPE